MATSVPDTGGRHHGAGAGRPRRPVLAAVRRPAPSRASTCTRRPPTWCGRPSRAWPPRWPCWRRRRRRPGRPPGRAPGRRRPDAVGLPDAAPGRPAPGAGRGVRVTPRHRPRGRRARPDGDSRGTGPSSGSRCLRRRRGYEPLMDADEAGRAARPVRGGRRTAPWPRRTRADRWRPEILAEVDVAVVGAGVVGCAVARHLALAGATVVVLDRATDVGDGTSKANTAVLHTGFDTDPGSLESRLVARGHGLLAAYAAAAGIAVERTGALLVAWDDEQEAALPGARGEGRGQRVRRGPGWWTPPRSGLRAPPRARCPGRARSCPDEWVIDPWSVTLAFATEAVACGRPAAPVGTGAPGDHGVGRPRARRCPAARSGPGGSSTPPDSAPTASTRLLGHRDFTVVPAAGAADRVRQAGPPAAHAYPPARSHRPDQGGAGVAHRLGKRAARPDGGGPRRPHRHGLDGGRDSTGCWPPGGASSPALVDEEVTAVYAGLRAATEHRDYQIRIHADQRYVTVGGIRSTGLTSSMAVADHVAGLLDGAGAVWSGPPRPAAVPSMPPLGASQVRPLQDPGAHRRRPGLRHAPLPLRAGQQGRGAGRLPRASAPPPTWAVSDAGPGP